PFNLFQNATLAQVGFIHNQQIDILRKFAADQRIGAGYLNLQAGVIVRMVTPDKADLVLREAILSKTLRRLVNQNGVRGDKQNAHTTTYQTSSNKSSQPGFTAASRHIHHER